MAAKKTVRYTDAHPASRGSETERHVLSPCVEAQGDWLTLRQFTSWFAWPCKPNRRSPWTCRACKPN